MKNSFVFFLLSSLVCSAATAGDSNAVLETNKKVVTQFYDLAFNQHQPKEAMDKYGGSDYIQHNPFVATGKQPFIDFFQDFQKRNPQSCAEIKRIIAEGDLVVVHVRSTLNPRDRGRAVMDIFRLENSKIVEHWDVGQSIPEKSANDNTMF